MPRIKKRIQKKKTIIKKTIIKKTNKSNKGDNKKTPEQQSRENDMLKVMLGRQPQVIPGQTQQNDKIQQQIDTASKALIDIKNENTALRDHLRIMQNQISEHKQEQAKIKADNKLKEKQQAEEERHLKEMERHLDKKDKLDAAQMDLEARKKEYDETTEEGKVRKQIDKAKRETRKKESEIKDKRTEIEQNTLYNKLKEVEDQNKFLDAELEALKNVIESDKFKDPSKELKDALTKKMLKETERRQQIQITQRMEEIANINAEIYASKKYAREFETPQQKIVMGKDGKELHTTGPSQKEIYENQLAEQIKIKQKLSDELYYNKKLLESDATLKNKLTDEAMKNKEMNSELKIINKYRDSPDYKQKLIEIEHERNRVLKERERNDLFEKQLETKKRIDEMQARINMKKTFDPYNFDTATVAAQIDELTTNAEHVLTEQSKAMDVTVNRNRRIRDIENYMDKIAENYKNDNDKQKAFNNVLNLISLKTDGKLTQSINDYNLSNLTKASEFINMLSNVSPEILINEDQYERFLQTDDYKNFKWDTLETNTGE